MAEATRLVRDDAYEEIGSAYQCLQVSALDAAMQAHGVGDAAVRQKVAESFLFAMGNLHDQGWLKPSAEAGRCTPCSASASGSSTPTPRSANSARCTPRPPCSPSTSMPSAARPCCMRATRVRRSKRAVSRARSKGTPNQALQRTAGHESFSGSSSSPVPLRSLVP